MALFSKRNTFLLSILLTAMVMFYGGQVSADTVDVSIPGLNFSPASLTINSGTTVRWTNNHSLPHTTTSDNGIWDSGSLSPGQSYARTFDSTGEFPYHCSFHPSMTASISVAASHAVPSLSPFAFLSLWLIIILLAWGTYRRRASILNKKE
ncbi:MAG: cupredoxin family copper-binding protein [Candidatus Zixiibacteriota bacterium]